MDLYVAAVCFMREFWDLEERGVEADPEADLELQEASKQHELVRPTLQLAMPRKLFCWVSIYCTALMELHVQTFVLQMQNIPWIRKRRQRHL